MSHIIRKGLVAGALLLISAACAAAEPATFDTNLNLRSGPGSAFGVVVVMPAGSKVDVRTCGPEWCQVTFGRQAGYVSKGLLKSGTDSFASVAAPAAQAEAKPTLVGPHIWRWHDVNWRNENWRELDWHNRMK